jgi:outer membrane murein-binding lipoprotein Lpp
MQQEQELTIVTRFRAEVDDQNKKLRKTSEQLTALAKGLDSSVEGFDRFRSTVDGAVDRLKLFGRRGQMMAEAINKNIHDPIKRASMATSLWAKEQERAAGPGSPMDKMELAARKLGFNFDMLKAKLGALYRPLTVVGVAVLGLAAAVGKKLFDNTKKYVLQAKEFENVLGLLSERMERLELTTGQWVAEFIGLEEAMRDINIGFGVFERLIGDSDAAAAVFRSTIQTLLGPLGLLVGKLDEVLGLAQKLGAEKGLWGLIKRITPVQMIEENLGLHGGVAPKEVRTKAKKFASKAEFDAKEKAVDKENFDALRKKEAAEAKARKARAEREAAERRRAWAKRLKDGERRRSLMYRHMRKLESQYTKFKASQSILRMKLDAKEQGLRLQAKIDKVSTTVPDLSSSQAILDEKRVSVGAVIEAQNERIAGKYEPMIGQMQRFGAMVGSARDQFVALGSAFGAGFGAFAAGEGSMKDLGKTMLGVLGDIAMQWGQFFLFEGLGFEFLPGGQGFSVGLTAAGLGLTALGGALKAFGGKGSPSGGGGGSAAFNTASIARDIQPKEERRQETVVQVYVAGDQIRNPLWRVVNEGLRTGNIQPAGA